jgi:hypothetical protein
MDIERWYSSDPRFGGENVPEHCLLVPVGPMHGKSNQGADYEVVHPMEWRRAKLKKIWVRQRNPDKDVITCVDGPPEARVASKFKYIGMEEVL